jgi:Caspase domain
MLGSFVTLPAPDLPSGPRYALVIGTSTYEDSRLGALRAPAQDADDFASALGDPSLGGFSVTTLLDSSVHAIRVAVDDFLTSRAPGDTVVVYLSCHGLLTARRRLYFAASDTVQDRVAATGIEARWLIDCLDECRARRQVVILDCCFSGAFAMAKGVEDVGLDERFAEVAEQGRGRVVLTASRATEYSFEGKTLTSEEAASSVFTAALLDGLRTGAADQDRDGFVTVSEAYSYAYAQLRQASGRQNPQRWVYGGEGQEVILTRSPAGIAIRPAQIDEELRAGLESRFPHIRIGAVNALAAWLSDSDPARVIAAHAAIVEIADQEIPQVAQVARTHLVNYLTSPFAITIHAEGAEVRAKIAPHAIDRPDSDAAHQREPAAPIAVGPPIPGKVHAKTASGDKQGGGGRPAGVTARINRLSKTLTRAISSHLGDDASYIRAQERLSEMPANTAADVLNCLSVADASAALWSMKASDPHWCAAVLEAMPEKRASEILQSASFRDRYMLPRTVRISRLLQIAAPEKGSSMPRRSSQEPPKAPSGISETTPHREPELIAGQLDGLDARGAARMIRNMDPVLAEQVLDLLGTRKANAIKRNL